MSAQQEGHVWDVGPLQVKLLYRTCGAGGHQMGHQYETLMVSWRDRYLRLRLTWGRTDRWGQWTVPRPFGVCAQCIGVEWRRIERRWPR